MSKTNSISLIEELLKTIDRVGMKSTIESLKETQNILDGNQILQKFIVIETCKEFKIAQNTLLQGRKNTANRTNAIGVCSILLKRHCKITQSEIGIILRKDVSNVNKYIKKFNHLDSKFKSDVDILISIEKIEDIVNNFNNKLNNG
tara:strand:+ start:777 stop:1214 length:438 start_codon:yes stop_codon:yes gene_type:complete